MNPARTILLSVTLLLACACGTLREEPVEIGLDVRCQVPVKGYIPGTALWDTPAAGLHGDAEGAPRTLTLTAWYYGPTGKQEEYFRGSPFARDAASGLWRRTPAAWWPMGGRLDLAGYSAGVPFAEDEVSWDPLRSTDAFSLDIASSHSQDDVLFGIALSRRHADATEGIAMTLEHAQAWIQFSLHAASGLAGVVTVEDIMIEHLYTSGRLTVAHPFGFAEGEWSFVYDERRETVLDDPHGVYGTTIGTETKYVDQLIPEQRMHKDGDGTTHIVLHYRMAGSDHVMAYAWELPRESWLMGRRYTYDITFAPRGIEIVPLVASWSVASWNTDYYTIGM